MCLSIIGILSAQNTDGLHASHLVSIPSRRLARLNMADYEPCRFIRKVRAMYGRWGVGGSIQTR